MRIEIRRCRDRIAGMRRAAKFRVRALRSMATIGIYPEPSRTTSDPQDSPALVPKGRAIGKHPALRRAVSGESSRSSGFIAGRWPPGYPARKMDAHLELMATKVMPHFR